MMRKYLSAFFLSLCALVMLGCSDKDAVADNTASVTELTIGGVTFTTADLSARLTMADATNFLKQGFCYGTMSDPTIDNALLCEVRGDLKAQLQGLQPSTTYYVRAYALVGDNLVYSDVSHFTTATKTQQDILKEDLANYVCPAYEDNYVNFAGWGDRQRWNLANVHDPSVMKADDGYYYMYQTDASYGNAHDGHGHFHCRRSKDLVNWEYLGATMLQLPAWVKPKLNEIRAQMGLGESAINWSGNEFGYWAPCARKVKEGLYRMYYALTMPGTMNGDNSWGERAFIGMMETSDPADVNSWVDKGYVITNSSDRQLNFNVRPDDWANCYNKFNAIDPSYIITENGEHWLVYGSWHSGIAAVKLNAETGKPEQELGVPFGSAADIQAYGKLVYTRQRNNRWQASEAPEVVYHDGYYYLFLAYDELSVAYNTRVVRSKNIDGPYYGIDGTNLTQYGGEAFPIVTHPYRFGTDHGWVGISHCAVFDDGQGNWFFSSQGRLPANWEGNAYSNAVMMGQVRQLVWTESGWPVVMPERYGAVPQAAIEEQELVGDWENVTLAYSYQRQCGSVSFSLGADHKVTGSWMSGQQWSFDAVDNVLTVGNLKLSLRREVDWEASPRKVTLVYAGLSTNGRSTYWGKKK